MAMITAIAIEPWNAWDLARTSHYYGWNKFSFFTVQSNFIAAVTYLIAATTILRKKKLGEWFRYLRGAAVLYMLITGIVFALLLQNTEVNPDPGHFNWKNFILHQWNPFFITVWWLLWPSRLAITSRESFLWLIFPIFWIIYTFIRALFTNWYPYPFLDPDNVGGIAGVSFYVLGITVLFFILGQLLAWVSRVRANNYTLY